MEEPVKENPYIHVGFYIRKDQMEWIRSHSSITGVPGTELLRRAIDIFKLKEELKKVAQ